MVTLQLVSIYDMVCAAVLAAWVGSAGFLLVRTIFRVVNVAIGNRSNATRIFMLENELIAMQKRKRIRN